MALDLERMKAEMLDFLKESGMAVFYGNPPTGKFPIFWDIDRHSDFREFVSVARQADVKIVIFSEKQFSAYSVEHARMQIEDCELTREEARGFENRLRQFEAYEGFTCSLDLSFHVEGQAYIFGVETEWLRTFHQLRDELDSYLPEADAEELEDEEENGPMGGYFSNN